MSALRLVSSALSEDTATALAVTLVQSRLDYANSFCLKLPLPISKSSREPKTCWHRLFIVLPNLRGTTHCMSFYLRLIFFGVLAVVLTLCHAFSSPTDDRCDL